jgi:hypothetical protein
MENYSVESEKSNAGQGMGIASLVLGILAVITSFVPCFGAFALIFGALAIVFGALGLSQAKRGGGRTGMPIAGLILGVLATLFIIIWVIIIAGAIAVGASNSGTPL